MMLGVIGFLILDRLHLRLRPDEAAALTGIVLMAGAFATLLAQWGLIPLLTMSPRTAVLLGAALGAAGPVKIGRAAGRGRVCTYVEVSVVGVSLKKNTKSRQTYKLK